MVGHGTLGLLTFLIVAVDMKLSVFLDVFIFQDFSRNFSMLRVKKSQLRPERHQVPGRDAACLVGRVGRATRRIDANAVH